jgi:hypothetical protein
MLPCLLSLRERVRVRNYYLDTFVPSFRLTLDELE